MRANEIKIGQSFTRAMEDGIFRRVAPSLPDKLHALYGKHVWAIASDDSLVVVHPDNSVQLTQQGAGTLPFSIEHHAGGGHRFTGRVEVTDTGLEVFFDKYGMHGTENGAPVFIEIDKGHPMIRIWSELASEDATHNVSLESAIFNRQ